ncbi:hypothetical protein M422DRAFT_270214 [Sphaerobolus stellatus SS14]|uniref:Uncharacterized protein n=1 Tax=Sphaerobolus stellatus (strain SS14) TaxID=990650 RepID=A0A0C9UTN1_SPHS4|nr:hypothetical protein M422DRAFT_270214 [Sphaerobolus stellatus SS14]
MGNKRSLSAQRKSSARKKKKTAENPENGLEWEIIGTDVEPQETGAEKEVRCSTRVRKPPPSTLQSIQEEIEGNLNETDSLLMPSAPLISPPSTVTNSSTSANTWLWDDDRNYDDDIDFFQRDIEDALKVAKSKGKKTKDSGPGNDDLALFVTLPSGCSTASCQVQIYVKDGFDEAIHKIHEAMGCIDCSRKPTLQYKMSGTGRTPIELLERAHWDNLIIGACLAAKRKMVVPVEILVMEDWYMENLRKRNGVKQDLNAKKTATAGKGKSAAKTKHVELDSMDPVEENATPEDESAAAKDLEEFTRLKRHLSGCPIHNELNQYCKINKFGAHVLLTVSQVAGWAHALAIKTYGVTYDNPPRSQMFDDFHSKQPGVDGHSNPNRGQSAPPGPIDPNQTIAQTVQSVATAIAVVQSMKFAMDNPASAGTRPFVMEAPSLGAIGSNKAATEANIDGSESDIGAEDITYPEVKQFFEDLEKKEPHRKLTEFANALLKEDFYCIDELEGKTASFFIGAPFNLTMGNASFIEKKLKAAIQNARKVHRLQGK